MSLYVTPWTDDDVAMLTELWAAGKSASIIAAEMGRGRNSVIGKVHRLGLDQRVTKQRCPVAGAGNRTVWTIDDVTRLRAMAAAKKTPPEPRRKPSRPAPLPEVRSMFAEPVQTPQHGHVTIMDLRLRSCRYIVASDDRCSPDATFYCGEETVEGVAWCRHHLRLVSAPKTPARKVAA